MLTIKVADKEFIFELNERLNIEEIDNESCVYNGATKKCQYLT